MELTTTKHKKSQLNSVITTFEFKNEKQIECIIDKKVNQNDKYWYQNENFKKAAQTWIVEARTQAGESCEVESKRWSEKVIGDEDAGISKRENHDGDGREKYGLGIGIGLTTKKT